MADLDSLRRRLAQLETSGPPSSTPSASAAPYDARPPSAVYGGAEGYGGGVDYGREPPSYDYSTPAVTEPYGGSYDPAGGYGASGEPAGYAASYYPPPPDAGGMAPYPGSSSGYGDSYAPPLSATYTTEGRDPYGASGGYGAPPSASTYSDDRGGAAPYPGSYGADDRGGYGAPPSNAGSLAYPDDRGGAAPYPGSYGADDRGGYGAPPSASSYSDDRGGAAPYPGSAVGYGGGGGPPSSAYGRGDFGGPPPSSRGYSGLDVVRDFSRDRGASVPAYDGGRPSSAFGAPPPSSSYGAGGRAFAGPPSSSYGRGPVGASGFSGPPSTYGGAGAFRPTSAFGGPPASSYGSGPPASSYGTPSGFRTTAYSGPSSSYGGGVTRPASSFGGPATSPAGISGLAGSTPLPPNWAEAVDADGDVYFYNRVTKESSWDRPRWKPVLAGEAERVAKPVVTAAAGKGEKGAMIEKPVSTMSTPTKIVVKSTGGLAFLEYIVATQPDDLKIFDHIAPKEELLRLNEIADKAPPKAIDAALSKVAPEVVAAALKYRLTSQPDSVIPKVLYFPIALAWKNTAKFDQVKQCKVMTEELKKVPEKRREFLGAFIAFLNKFKEEPRDVARVWRPILLRPDDTPVKGKAPDPAKAEDDANNAFVLLMTRLYTFFPFAPTY